MKKSLIALAVLATAGTAFAQSTVTLSGKFAAAYTSQSITNVTANGLGVTDGNVTFAAVEDLGSGLKAGVSMDVRVRGRAAAGSVDGRDGIVYVKGGFGTLKAGAVEAGNGLVGLGNGGAPVQGLDDSALITPTGAVGTKVLDSAGNVDVLAYTSNVFAGGFTATVQLIDSIGAPGANGTEDTNAVTQDAVLVGVGYAAGPLVVSADYTGYGYNSVTSAAATDKRVRLSGSYNFGMVKLGAGFQTKTTQTTVAGVVTAATAVDDKQYLLGISAPVGSSTVIGATYGRHTNNVALSNDATGVEFGAQYNLSKRTNIQFAYARISAANATFDNTKTRIRLMHAF